uniref:MADF domain-containing protein n=1 Tax=Ditylenchus dipsaci TaxID=166011 RepID=A0A915D1H4_9BILA
MSDYKDIKRLQSEALIEAVRQEPCLYDYSAKLYRNKPHKNRLRETANDRWVNLRNQYGKLHKTARQSSGNGLDDDQPQWPYYEALGFLEPHMKERMRAVSLNDCFDMFDSNDTNSVDPAIERLKHIQCDQIKTSPDGFMESAENCSTSSTCAKYPNDSRQPPPTASFPNYYEPEQKKARIQVDCNSGESLLSYMNRQQTEGELFGKCVGMRLDRMEPRKSALARIEIEKILFKFEFE